MEDFLSAWFIEKGLETRGTYNLILLNAKGSRRVTAVILVEKSTMGLLKIKYYN